MSEPQEITFSLTSRDARRIDQEIFWKAAYSYFYRVGIPLGSLWWLTELLIGLVKTAPSVPEGIRSYIFPVIPLYLFIFYGIRGSWQLFGSWTRSLRQRPAFFTDQQVALRSEGLLHRSGRGTFDFPWETVRGMTTFAECFCISTGEYDIVIPQSSFPTPEAAKAFQERLQQHWTSAHGDVPPSPQPPTPTDVLPLGSQHDAFRRLRR